MAERVQIILEAEDLTSGVVRGIVSQFGEFGSILSDTSDALSKYNSFINLANEANTDASISAEDLEKSYAEAGVAMARLGETVAVFAVQQLKEAIEKTVEYNGEIKNLALTTDQSLEDTSRMVQVFGDLKIGISDLTPILKAMTKEGLVPNIETIAKLSDQYNAIQDPVQKNEFLFKNFGRAGADLAFAMSQGGDALLRMNDAIDESLIVTTKAWEASEKYRLALDELEDTGTGLQHTIGNLTFDPLSKGLQLLNKNIEESTQSWQDFLLNAIPVVSIYRTITNATDLAVESKIKERDELEKSRDAALSASDGLSVMIQTEEDLKRAAEESTEAIQRQSEVNNGLLSLTMSLAEENATYNEKLGEAIAKYGEGSTEVQELKAAHADALLSMATDLEIAKLKADGFTDAEHKMAIAMLEASGQIDSSAAQTALAMDAIATAAQNAGEQGMAKYAEIMKSAMEDGMITIAEQQVALEELNTIAPQEQMNDLAVSTEETKEASQSVIDDMQSSYDSFSTEHAIEEINALKDAINELPATLPTTGTGAQDTGFAQDTRSPFAPASGGGTVQNFYIQNASFIGQDGGFTQL